MSKISKIIEETGNSFDEKFPEQQKEPTHFDDCVCWSCNNYRNEVKQFISDSQLALLNEVKKIIEEKMGKQGSQSGSYGFQGIVMEILTFQTELDQKRDDLLQALSLTNKEDEKETKLL